LEVVGAGRLSRLGREVVGCERGLKGWERKLKEGRGGWMGD
jgi:hypothetical protein